MFTTLSGKFQVYGVTWLRFNNSKEVCVLIEVRDLVKQYGNRLAVDHLSFTVPDGQIFGFLGPNGAGKSTTMNLMTGYLGPTSGEILVDGFSVTKEPEKAKRCIGYLPELPPLYMDMTVEEYLRFAVQLKKVPKSEREAQVDRVAGMTGVDQVLGRLIRNLSKGYRQRVGLAQALIGFPHILILDEPTVGLDPKQILEIRALIRELAQEHTVILSSHILSEVQEVCDHIFIIHHGRLVAQGTPAQLERELAGTPAITLLLKAAPEEGRVLLSGVPGVAEVAPLPCGEAGAALLRLTPAEGADPREAVFRACAGADLPILEMRRESLSLEQIFLELTSDASAAGQAGGRRRPFGRRDSAEPEPAPAPETAITEHGEEAEP